MRSNCAGRTALIRTAASMLLLSNLLDAGLVQQPTKASNLRVIARQARHEVPQAAEELKNCQYRFSSAARATRHSH